MTSWNTQLKYRTTRNIDRPYRHVVRVVIEFTSASPNLHLEVWTTRHPTALGKMKTHTR